METRERIAARKWVQKAIALYESGGEKAVLAEIADPQGLFILGDRYIFALDIRGTVLAHPVAHKMTGRVVIDLKDSDGKDFVRRIVDVSNRRGYGFIDYKWHRPGSKEESRKTAFFEKIDTIIFCSGFYD